MGWGVRLTAMKTEPEKLSVAAPAERLLRMRTMFERDGAILAEDYQYFTKQGAATAPNRVARKSAKSHGRPSPKRN